MTVDDREASRSGQIVAELRRRIETGELAPGDRVPSTREIVRRWDVAMATATKVLTRLRHEGLVRAVPGVGTVVDTSARPGPGSPPRPGAGSAARPGAPAATRPGTSDPARSGASESRRSGGDRGLTPERIISTAVAVADAEGLSSVSMRRVAVELGVATMSLYRHVADKDDLLLRMMDASFAESALPDDPPKGWRNQLELAARTLWAMCRRHPWLAPSLSMSRPQLIVNALPFTEWTLATLARQGLDLQTALTAQLAMLNYIRGTAINLEAEAEAEALSGVDAEEYLEAQLPAMHEVFATGRFPVFERLVAKGYDYDLDVIFEFGLRRVLDGIAVLIGETPS